MPRSPHAMLTRWSPVVAPLLTALAMRRYVNTPTASFPWDRDHGGVH